MNRKWLPNLAELLDRLSIHQLKEVLIPEQKEKYRLEMRWILHDIDELIQESEIKFNSELLRLIIINAQINTHIWYNEAKARKGEQQDLQLLRLTHGLNGIRNRAMNRILDMIGEGDRKDWKADCLAADFADWEVAFDLEEEHEICGLSQGANPNTPSGRSGS